MMEGGLPRSNNSMGVTLASASAGGTIATVRCLGTVGYNVDVLYNSRLSASVWSRYTKNAHLVPTETEPRRFLARLVRIGEARPGNILLPTSDETAWLYSANAEILQRHFRVYQPPIETIRRILDKAELAAAAARVSMAVPHTWDPLKITALPRLAETLPYPILIKARTHVHRIDNDKGVIVESRQQLLQELDAFIDREKLRSTEDPLLMPNARSPLLQRYVSGGPGAVSITGFIDRSGGLFVTRRSVKVFQRFQKTGVGVCFESLPADPDLSEAVHKLCRELGYFGIFEVEFVWAEGKWALIDFNPRLFNQVGMDILRAMPLPLFACLDAAGETEALRDAVERARAHDQSEPAAIYDGFTLRAILLARSLRGSGSSAERDYWRSWTRRYAGRAIDLAADRHDWAPGVVHAISETYLGLRALPRFLRATPRSSATTPVVAKIPS